jgi:hypothetical protein
MFGKSMHTFEEGISTTSRSVSYNAKKRETIIPESITLSQIAFDSPNSSDINLNYLFVDDDTGNTAKITLTQEGLFTGSFKKLISFRDYLQMGIDARLFDYLTNFNEILELNSSDYTESNYNKYTLIVNTAIGIHKTNKIKDAIRDVNNRDILLKVCKSINDLDLVGQPDNSKIIISKFDLLKLFVKYILESTILVEIKLERAILNLLIINYYNTIRDLRINKIIINNSELIATQLILVNTYANVIQSIQADTDALKKLEMYNSYVAAISKLGLTDVIIDGMYQNKNATQMTNHLAQMIMADVPDMMFIVNRPVPNSISKKFSEEEKLRVYTVQQVVDKLNLKEVLGGYTPTELAAIILARKNFFKLPILILDNISDVIRIKIKDYIQNMEDYKNMDLNFIGQLAGLLLK